MRKTCENQTSSLWRGPGFHIGKTHPLPTSLPQGTKRWTIFHPEDAWCLQPTWSESEPRLEPTFPDLDAMQADHSRYPHLRLAR